MQTVFRITLIIAGVINFLPSLLAFFPDKLSEAYGIELVNNNLEIVLRHRAILLGLVGALMIYSAIVKRYYMVSVMIGFISMISFVLLFYLIGDINDELFKVLQFDWAAILILLLGLILYKFKK